MDGKTLKDAWVRWSGVWHVVFFSLCTLALGLVVLDPSSTNDPILPILLTGLLMAWYAVSLRLSTLPPLGWVAFFAVGWAIWYALAGYNPAFMLVLSGLFPHVFILTGLRLAVGLALMLNTLVLLQLQRINADLTATWMLIMSVAWAGGALLGYYITAIIRQSQERQTLIEQLKEAQTTIAAMERQAGIAHERQRLAGELHDTIAQGLIGIVTHLEAADAAADDAAAQRYSDGAKRMARENLREVRHFIWELRPPALEGRKFEEGVRQVAESWAHMHGVSAEVVITGSPQLLSPAHELALLRVTQEALANVGKHAHAHFVTITLSYVPNAVLLDINDDGQGLTAPLNVVGYGLINMRERIETLGGTLSIESSPHDGTTLVVELPLNGK